MFGQRSFSHTIPLIAWHLHLVAVLLPVETLVTLCSWCVWFFYPQGLLSLEALAIGYREFDAAVHYCLHLAPWIGLLADLAGERDHYRYDRRQGVGIGLAGVSYVLWLGFLYKHSGVIVCELDRVALSPCH